MVEPNTDGPEWSPEHQRGFDEAYSQTGYHPPEQDEASNNFSNTEKIQTRRKDYRFGFQAAAYTVLEEECPTINDAITLMHTSATSSENDILK